MKIVIIIALAFVLFIPTNAFSASVSEIAEQMYNAKLSDNMWDEIDKIVESEEYQEVCRGLFEKIKANEDLYANMEQQSERKVRELAKIVEDYYGIACQFNRNLWDVSTQPISVKPTSEIVCGSGTVEKNGQCIVDPNHQSLEKLQTKPSLGGGCLIATATYGSELAPQVQQLREIRDNSLLQTQSGSSFMRTFNDFYYSFSPIIADYERENPIFKEAVKMSITPMISSLSLLNHVNMDSESEVLGYGIALIMLNGMIYLGIPASMIVLVRKF